LAAERDATKVKVVAKETAAPAECDDGVAPPASPQHPEADSGFLCTFIANAGGTPTQLITKSGNSGVGIGASTAGAVLRGQGAPESAIWGTFAVTG
jgi:hypothetical protein